MRQKERALTLSSPSMEPRAASLSPREERARAGGAVKEDIGCEAKEFACKIYSPRTLKEVAIENPNDADQAAEIVLSELHTDLILPLPWKRKGLGGIYERDVVFATAIEDFGSDHNDFHFAALGDKLHILSFSTTTKDLSFNTKLNCEPLI